MVLAVVMTMGASTASAGILIADLRGDTPDQPCTNDKETQMDWGILMADFGGVVVHGFTGIIVAGAAEVPVDCGVVVHG